MAVVLVSRNPVMAMGLASAAPDVTEVAPSRFDEWLQSEGDVGYEALVLDLGSARAAVDAVGDLRARGHWIPVLLIASNPDAETELTALPRTQVLGPPVSTARLSQALAATLAMPSWAPVVPPVAAAPPPSTAPPPPPPPPPLLPPPPPTSVLPAGQPTGPDSAAEGELSLPPHELAEPVPRMPPEPVRAGDRGADRSLQDLLDPVPELRTDDEPAWLAAAVADQMHLTRDNPAVQAPAPVVAEAVHEPPPEPAAETLAEPLADAVPEPMAEAVPEPVAADATEPVAEALRPAPVTVAAPAVAARPPEPADLLVARPTRASVTAVASDDLRRQLLRDDEPTPADDVGALPATHPTAAGPAAATTPADAAAESPESTESNVALAAVLATVPSPRVGPAAVTNAHAAPAPSTSPDGLVNALLEVQDRLFSVSETAQVVIADALARVPADAAALLVPDRQVWRVGASQSLRPLETRYQLEPDDWLVVNVAHASKGVIVEGSDVARNALRGAPLASRRHLLAVPIPTVQAILLMARDDEPAFDERVLGQLAQLAREAGSLLAEALRVRELARALADFREDD